MAGNNGGPSGPGANPGPAGSADPAGGEGAMNAAMRASIVSLMREVLDERDAERRRNGDRHGENGNGNPVNGQILDPETGLLINPQTGLVDLKWRPEDIGFFHPDADDPADYSRQGNATVWRNVYLFIEAVQHNAVAGREPVVRANLHTCLKGIAQTWYAEELEETTRLAFRFAPNGLKLWTEYLTTRFKDAMTTALKKLQAETYTADDARARKDVRAYAAAIIRHSKAAHLDKAFQQLSYVYNNLDPTFRPFVPKPTETSTITNYMMILAEKQETWTDMLLAQSQPGPRRLQPQNGGRYHQISATAEIQNRQRPYRPFVPGMNFRPQYPFSQFRFQQGERQANVEKTPEKQALPAPKNRLQITAGYQGEGSGPKNVNFDNKSSNQPFNGQRFRRFRRYDGANYSNEDYYDIPTEDGQKHDVELQNMGYIATEEVTFPAAEAPEAEDVSAMAFDNGINYGFSGTESPPKELTCRKCGAEFPTRSKLFKHIWANSCMLPKPKELPTDAKLTGPYAPAFTAYHPSHDGLTEKAEPRLIEARPLEPRGGGIPGWTFMKLEVRHGANDEPHYICVDTGCTRQMVDRQWISQHPNVRYDKSLSTTFKGIKGCVRLTERAFFDIYIPGEIDGKPTVARMAICAWVMDRLEPKLLLGNEFLWGHGAVIDCRASTLVFVSCENMTTQVSVCTKGPRVFRKILSNRRVVIPPHARAIIPVKTSNLPEGRAYFFNATLDGAQDAVTESADCVTFVNNTARPRVLPAKIRLGYLSEYEAYTTCFIATEQEQKFPAAELAQPTRDPGVGKKSPKKNLCRTTPKKTAPVTVAEPPSDAETVDDFSASQSQPGMGLARPDDVSEEVLENGIHVCTEDPELASDIKKLTTQFADCWKDRGVIQMPESEYMRIPLADGWQNGKLSSRPYPLGIRQRAAVDAMFNSLHDRDRMEFTTTATPFGCAVFVVSQANKDRPVVDLRPLNKWAIYDSYPTPTQSDIIECLRGKNCISVFDGTGFFYQFPVWKPHRDRFTILSHRGQEQSKVALMGFKNSVQHVQRFLDRKLRPYKHFARSFVDDIVVFSDNPKEHVEHLRQVLSLFLELRLCLSAKKSFLGYSSVKLLGHKVNGLGLATTEQRIAAIKNLEFPETLKNLERYLGMTGWLRSFIPFYSKLAEPLQKRKTDLLAMGRQNGVTDNNRKSYVSRTKWDPTEEELKSFKNIQNTLCTSRFLIHNDPQRQLFLKIDASAERGFGVMAFHLRLNQIVPKDMSTLKSTWVEPITFLSKLLGPAEKHYHPTELEVACLVWTCRKLRVMIQSSTSPVIVLTDHSATKAICTQTSLITTDSSRANMRLVNASKYLSQYELEIHHIPGRLNIVPDALSRLPAREESDVSMDNELDNVFASSEAFLDEGYKDKITQGLWADRNFARALRLLGCKDSDHPLPDSASKAGINFVIQNGLLYHKTADKQRLAIPSNVLQDVISTAHDAHHFGIERTRHELQDFCIPRLTKRLRDYINHCPSCERNSTLRTAPNGELQPIRSEPVPFRTIAMDFILGLPTVPAVAPWKIEGHDFFDTLLTVTDKFSKKTLLIPGHSTYTAEDWATVLLQMLLLCDWGIPTGIISDRDSKFTSDLWRALWKRLGTRLLMSTAWHPQTDGLSERKNQTAEIAIRHFALAHPDLPWTSALVALQAGLNNAYSAAINTSPNELVYGFRPSTELSVATGTATEQTGDYNVIRKLLQQDAQIAIDFAANTAKERYDRKHTPITMDVGQMVYLRLHNGYNLPGKPNPKISEQRTGPFKILRRVGRLAYEIELPPAWKIHPVISVAHLSPAAKGRDPYERPIPDAREPVEGIDGDSDEWKSYELERIVDKRYTNYGKRKNLEYLVKFAGWGNQWNEWYPVELLGNAKQLIEEYENRLLPPRPRRGRPPKAAALK